MKENCKQCGEFITDKRREKKDGHKTGDGWETQCNIFYSFFNVDAWL